MDIAEPPPLPRPFLRGVLDCINVPALGLGLTMVGFGAMAQGTGLALDVTWGITLFVWGIAGQIAIIDIHAAGGDLLAVFIASALANLRMLPMTVTGLPYILKGRSHPLIGRLAIAQSMAISCWTQIITRSDHVPSDQKLPYYWGFACALVVAGITGVTIGHQLGRIVPDSVMTIAVFMTPLYLLLLICGARQWASRFSVLFGILLGVGFYPVLGDWAVVLAGLLGGTLGYLSGPVVQRLGWKEG